MGSNEKVCKSHGATDVINYRKESIRKGLKRLRVKKIDLVYECVSTPEAFEISEEFGCECFVTIDPGMTLFSMVKTLLRSVWQNMFMSFLGHPNYYFFLNGNYVNARTMDRFVELLDRGVFSKLDHVVEYNFTTKGLQDALNHVKGGKGGKVLLKLR